MLGPGAPSSQQHPQCAEPGFPRRVGAGWTVQNTRVSGATRRAMWKRRTPAYPRLQKGPPQTQLVGRAAAAHLCLQASHSVFLGLWVQRDSSCSDHTNDARELPRRPPGLSRDNGRPELSQDFLAHRAGGGWRLAAGTVSGNPRSKLPGLGRQGKRTRRVCLVFCKPASEGAEQDLPELCWGHGA